MLINGKRALAYTSKVLWVKPIQNADNIEEIGVLGWHLIAKKDEFKEGDICVYFEIDSKLPEAEWSNFMTNRGYKVKTMKLNKFGVVSQGLALRTDIDSRIPNEENVDVTDLLGVTYYVKADNKRKANVDKYASMKAKYKDLLKKPPYKWLMRYKWGRDFLNLFLGKKTNDWCDWVVKTDEERCLLGCSQIITDRGLVQIQKIVNHKLPVKVASINKEGKLEYKKILDYQKFVNNDDLITLTYPYKVGSTRSNKLCCTKDHKVLTNRGYIRADELTLNDCLYNYVSTYNEDCLPALYGMLLGDSHISIDKRSGGCYKIGFTQSEKQLDYLKYKKSVFNDESKITNCGIMGFSKVNVYKSSLGVDAFIDQEIRKDWFINGVRTLTDNVINRLNEISLAFWYLDDGSITYRNDQKTAYWVRLATNDYTLEENNKLVNMLKDKFDIKATLHKDKINKKGEQMYNIAITSTEESNKFFDLIYKYVCDSMNYKLPIQYHNLDKVQLSYTKTEKLFKLPITNIQIGQYKMKHIIQKPKYVYDIEVEDNHNFIADNIVNHNCQNLPFLFTGEDKQWWIVTEKIDGTSTTFTLKRKGLGKPKFYVCSRNVVFTKGRNQCYYDVNYYTMMAEKYDIENVLRKLMTKDLDFITLQGETYGNGVQKRNYSINDQDFKAFNLIYGYKNGEIKKHNTLEMKEILEPYGIQTVPVLDTEFVLPKTCDEMVSYADGESVLDGKIREGVVVRTYDCSQSFKAVSTKYLLSKNAE